MNENKREFGSQSTLSNDEIGWISTASIFFYKNDCITFSNAIGISKDVFAYACVFSPKF